MKLIKNLIEGTEFELKLNQAPNKLRVATLSKHVSTFQDNLSFRVAGPKITITDSQQI
jgi:hypothetical protein